MAKKRLNKVLTFVSGLLSVLVVTAQELPLLPTDAAVSVAQFPNGMTCYVTANPYVRGFADLAVVRRSDMSVVSRQKNTLVADKARMDSSLLAMVRTVGDSGAPADHAVVVCGDLDTADVMNAVRYMSFMVPSGDTPAVPECPPGEVSGVSFRQVPDGTGGSSAVLAEWSSPRTPWEMMNTVQKAVYDKTVYEFGHIACERIRRGLKMVGADACDVRLHHKGSLDGPGEETFILEVKVKDEYLRQAADILKEVLCSIDAHGAYASELRLAEAAYLSALSVKAEDRSNEAYVDRCIASYLYNAPLTSPEGLMRFHRSKEVSDGLRESVFAGISSALLDIESAGVSRPAERYVDLADTLALPDLQSRMALRSSGKDHLSGGVLWTFFNGFKVVYRKMPTKGVTYYSLAVNGGYGSAGGNVTDGGRYLSEYMDSCYISGLRPDYFADMLQLAGVTMDAKVNFSNVIVSGQAANEDVGLLMKSLLALANERSSDDELLDRISAHMNDGVLVIVSDMEESRLRRQLSSYVGGFRTRENARRYVNVDGRYPFAGDDAADDGRMLMDMSARLPLTIENCAAADIASLVLKCRLEEVLSPFGLEADVSHTLRIYPEDRYSVRIVVGREDGQDTDPALLREAGPMVKKSLDTDVDADLLAAAKAAVKHRRKMDMESPSYWLHAIALRHLDGKDFTTGYEAEADAVTSDKIKSLFSLLND